MTRSTFLFRSLTVTSCLGGLMVASPAEAQLSLGAKAEAKAETNKEPSASASATADADGEKAKDTPEADKTATPDAESDAAETPKADSADDKDDWPAEDDEDAKPAAKKKPAAAKAKSTEPATKSPAVNQEPGSVDYGNLYTFGVRGKRTRGIPNGSLIQRSHGLHMDYRKTGLMLSGNAWIDTGYRKQIMGLDTAFDIDKWLQQGRFLLRATPTLTYGNWFVQGQGEIMARAQVLRDNTIDTDDAWLRFGYWDVFDVTFGRFEGWEVYHKGVGLERDTLEDEGAAEGVDTYEVNHLFYREDEVGQVAAHYYPFDWMRFEVASAVGSKSDYNHLGVRPVMILDFDWLKLKGAAEVRQVSYGLEDVAGSENFKVTDEVGFGFGIQTILAPELELGLNGATGFVDETDTFGGEDGASSYDILSVGGFINTRFGWVTSALDGLLMGMGVNYTEQIWGDCGNEVVGGVEVEKCKSNVHRQFYGAVQHDIFSQATLKLVGGMALADLQERPMANPSRNNDAWNVRLRALMWF